MAFARFARDSGVTQEIQTIVDFDRDFWVDDNSLANRVNAIDPYIYFGFSIAPLPTDADFLDFASNQYKSPIGLEVNRTDRLTKHLSRTKAQAKNEYHTCRT